MNTRTSRLRFALLAALSALVLVLAPAALAGKPGGGSSSGLKLVLLNSSDGRAHWGQQVNFDVSTSASNPFVNVRCYQGTNYVYDGWRGFAPGAMDYGQPYTLSSPYWTGGAADCTARLVVYSKRGAEQTLGSLAFHVDA